MLQKISELAPSGFLMRLYINLRFMTTPFVDLIKASRITMLCHPSPSSRNNKLTWNRNKEIHPNRKFKYIKKENNLIQCQEVSFVQKWIMRMNLLKVCVSIQVAQARLPAAFLVFSIHILGMSILLSK